jgi:hydrogenase expression/formation protein HypE
LFLRRGMRDDRVLLAHGGGGRLQGDLLRKIILEAFGSTELARLNDGAVVSVEGGRLAFTTDGYVVDPLFFPGGDIGRLAVTGTVNDLAMMGAEPRFLSFSLVLEEGFPLEDLRRIVRSAAATAKQASVEVVCGDTKVVARGAADKVFVTTAGVGVVPAGVELGGEYARPGDRVLVSGSLGDHGVAILSARGELGLTVDIDSDCAPLGGLVQRLLSSCGGVRVLRDPTRGGLAAVLHEVAVASDTSFVVSEEALPVRPQVAAACEILGLDPLYLACEGRLVAVVTESDTEQALDALRSHPGGSGAVVVGEVTAGSPDRVILRTSVGGERIVDLPSGEQLPRIC